MGSAAGAKPRRNVASDTAPRRAAARRRGSRMPVKGVRPILKSAKLDAAVGRFAEVEAYAVATRTIPARRTIYREGEAAREFAAVLDGWAFRFRLLPDGRRQILSLVLPGEPIALHTLWIDRLSFSVQSLTALQLRLFDRQKLVQHMAEDGGLALRLGRSMAGEVGILEDGLTDLGRRTGLERAARLLLGLRARLDRRGMVDGDEFPFPLRQQHIADLLGMTPVHVSRVFGELRAMSLISRVGDAIAILDVQRLVEIAGP
jgi:CRP-like cAMP-binding protein